VKYQLPIKFTILLAVVGILLACSPEQHQTEKRLVLAVQAQSSNQHAQAFAGEVRAREEVNLSFRVAGKIQQRYVDDGVRVKAGQVLARLDDQDLVLQSQASGASVQALKADRDLAIAELARYQGLVEKQLVSKSMFDSKQAQANAAKARYQQAIAQSAVNTNQTGYATIRAPSSGVIIHRYVEAGQVVSAGQPVFTFAADGPREVAIVVAEQHLPNLSLGQSVWVELWADQAARIPGTIREIAASADAITRTYAVRIALDADEAKTHLGQSARVLMANQHATSLLVPMSALTEIKDKPAVWVINSKTGKIQKRSVTVQRYGTQFAEISKGLSQNEWIVPVGVHLLREGEVVQAVDSNNRPIVLNTSKQITP
jgi:multidrug efflux system membrane fusion protein